MYMDDVDESYSSDQEMKTLNIFSLIYYIYI